MVHHSPAPWTNRDAYIVDADGNPVGRADIFRFSTSAVDQVNYVNARLMSASPELLASAEWSLGQLCLHPPTCEVPDHRALFDAINKAKIGGWRHEHPLPLKGEDDA